MTTHREELINELAYVVGKDRAERMVSEMLMEDAALRLSEMTADLQIFDEFRDWLKRSDIGHAPQTWFLLAKVFQERDHRLAERQRAFAERTWGGFSQWSGIRLRCEHRCRHDRPQEGIVNFFERSSTTPCEMDEKTRIRLEQSRAFEEYIGRIAAERVSAALGSVVAKLNTPRGLVDDRTQDAHDHISNTLDEIIDALTKGKLDDS